MRLAAATLAAAGLAALTPAAGLAALSAADRAAIDRTLDVFVPAALDRRHSERAWALATPALHVGGTRAGWARGELPVMPFPAAGTHFHGWTVDAARPGAVDIVLLVHPRKGARVGAVSFDVRMRKARGRWLVDSFVPAAFFAAPGSVSHMLAAPDLAPGPAAPPYGERGRIGRNWVLVVGGTLLGVVLLAPVLVLVAHRLRNRRAARRYTSVTRGFRKSAMR
jgi:hypothetical protein